MADKIIRALLLVITVVCFLCGAYAAGPICFQCDSIQDPDACKNFHQCSDGQKCFKEVVQSEADRAIYTWGCASSQLCKLQSNFNSRRKRLGVERCYECCDDNFCNFGPCTTDYCANVTCQNGATCRNTALFPVCDCVLGYSGELCEAEINECDSSPCMNGGSCVDNIGSYRCDCPSGFIGTNCEIDVDECASDPCQNNGNCTDGPNSYRCTCEPGYFGDECESDIDECASSPCQGNATCMDLVNAYKCVCPGGFNGVNCEINIDECQNITCQNGGVCNDYINRYECKCKLGFVGDVCQISTGRVCYTCTDVPTVSDCTSEVVCEAHEECFIEHELVSPSVFNFNMGCVPTAMCDYLSIIEKRSGSAIQLCYECCDTNECNHHACAESRGLNKTVV